MIVETVRSPRPITLPLVGSTFSTASAQIASSNRSEIRNTEISNLDAEGRNARCRTVLSLDRISPLMRNRETCSEGSTLGSGMDVIE